ncbi:MAG: tRNA 2-thiouridine(34) synthase MnmA, partial [Planctomycetes bacterium]|nr:tRNA 2-thiouridine(34) synthase MnmA [Planctomycetota bacterium]
MRILVAMSGGVDSSTAALLLRRAGHDVAGAHLILSGGEESIGDVESAAAAIGIPVHTFRCREAFREAVLDPFVEAYRCGRTPNPCALCNERIKFGWLRARAEELGFEALATGHYARVAREGDRVRLLKARDLRKDQSYFLFLLDRRALAALRLPLGDLRKDDVRRIAGEAGLPPAERRESQEACFVESGDYRDIVPAGPPGPIVDREGRVLGTHRGLQGYTIGQRRGVRIAAGRPVYVCRIDVEGNRLVVGDREDCLRSLLLVEEPHWIAGAPPAERFQAEVRIR